MTTTQARPPLTDTTQQFASTEMGAVLSLQIQSVSAAADMLAEKDLLSVDATAGALIVTLPAVPYIGKPYLVKETSAANQVTVDAAGAGTIDGAANLVLPAGEGATFVARSIDPVTLLVTWSVTGQTAPNPGAGGVLLSANNLSELTATQVTARSNIGANTRVVSFTGVDLVAATARVVRIVWRGPDGTITNIDSVAELPTDGATTITASIEGVPVTGGVATIPLSVAPGGVGSATPTAANVITAGQRLELTIGGANTLIVVGEIGVWVTY